jgi:hypothetical protein
MHKRDLLLHLGVVPALVGVLSLAGCYKPDFSGLACESERDCGSLLCVDGTCVEGDPDASGAPTSTPTSSAADTTTSGPGSTDSAGASTGASSTTDESGACCNALDILFVIDQSMYMDFQCFEESFSTVMNSMHDLVYSTITGNIDSFHIGFTTASILPGNPPECQGIGALLRGKLDDICFDDKLHGKPYLTDEDQTIADDFLISVWCLLRVGTEYDLPEDQRKEQEDARPIQALLGALAPAANGPGGCNEGFSRPGVPLLVVMMTNTDQAPYLPVPDGEEPYDWWHTTYSEKGFDAAEGQNHTGFILINTPDIAPDPELCTVDESPRLLTFFGQFDDQLKRRYDICGLRKDGLEQGEKCSQASEDKLDAFSDFFFPALDELICDVCQP